jgi:small subunit ribosomal protein S9
MAANNLGYGTGRRKCAVARVWLENGDGSITINGREMDAYLGRKVLSAHLVEPLEAIQAEGKYNVKALVKGGGMTGQAGAVRLGIARALVEYDETMRKPLRDAGLLTRDARVKERKKYGRKKARRGFQFVKR